MMRSLKPAKKTVELDAPRVSRIRRDPPVKAGEKALKPPAEDREAQVVVVGVMLFAIAIMIIILGFSDYTS